MDPKELRGLYEAYKQVNAPQEVDEAVKGESSERRKDLAAERKAGHRPLPAKEGEKYASHKLSQMAYAKRKRMGEEFELDQMVESLIERGHTEQEAYALVAQFTLDEAIYSRKGLSKAAEMIAKRSTPSGRAKSGKGADVAHIRQIRGSGRGDFDREGLGGTPMTPTMAKNPIKKQNYIGTGNKAARRASALKKEEFVDEAQHARENPEKYEREQGRKYEPVRGEKTPMPPRGDKRREDFEKWYAKQMGR